MAEKEKPGSEEFFTNRDNGKILEKPKKSSIGLTISLIILVLVILGGAYWYFYIYNESTSKLSSTNSIPVPQTTQPTVVPEKPAPEDPLIAKFTNPTTGEKWYSEPKKLDGLGYFKGGADSYSNPEAYYEVGARNGNTIIENLTEDNPGGIVIFYEKAPDGTITAIIDAKNSASSQETLANNTNYVKKYLKKDIKIDNTTHYDSLDISKTNFPIGNDISLTGSIYSKYLPDGIPSKDSESNLKEYGSFKLNKISTKDIDIPQLTDTSYVLHAPMNIEFVLQYPNVPTDTTQYTWEDNKAIESISQGTVSPHFQNGKSDICQGSNSLTVEDNTSTEADFVKIGQTKDGQIIYTYKDPNNTIVKAFYSDYKEMRSPQDTLLSPSDILNLKGIIVNKDKAGHWLIYTRSDIFLRGGCGKPVVYLYPTKTENVTVKVGANVQKSDPTYNPTTGWKVLAQPNGLLTLNNKNYHSLFWEGLGNGTYPTLTSGTVVKQVDAAKTMRSQLKQQGLKNNEINDFMIYWEPKIPNKQYVRLTWFSTAEMNELAPLAISPKPQTLIRVFLDMNGIDKKTNIPTQNLTSIPRNGFTVVEWGGLLRGGIK